MTTSDDRKFKQLTKVLLKTLFPGGTLAFFRLSSIYQIHPKFFSTSGIETITIFKVAKNVQVKVFPHMDNIKKFFYYLIIVISTILILLTLLSLIYDLRFWYYKILDFPRLQYLILGVILTFLFILLNEKWKLSSSLLLVGLLAVIIIQGNLIYPYLLGEKVVPDFRAELKNGEDAFDIIIANVLITNRQSSDFLKIVEKHNPEILLVMEVDEWWNNELQVLKKEYPYNLEYPLDNAYGMSLYSKLPLVSEEIKFLEDKDVPSIHADIVLPSGTSFTFHGVHPVAPVPSKKYPDNVGEEEIALLKVGELVASDPGPSVVAGDFNDVSWSHTSRMFGEKGDLNNVRIGRGLYNTFDATSTLLRWPLDHYFVTDEFSLVELGRLSKFGSDHFPLYAKFVLE